MSFILRNCIIRNYEENKINNLWFILYIYWIVIFLNVYFVVE